MSTVNLYQRKMAVYNLVKGNPTLKRWLDMPVLESEEESTLLQAVATGKRASAALQTGLYDKGDYASLKAAEKAGKDARQLLVLRNLKLVTSEVIEWDAKIPEGHIHDLFDEGVIGLMEAIDVFDPKRAGRLSSAAIWYIRKRIRRAAVFFTHGPGASMSAYARGKAALIAKVKGSMIDIMGREPTIDEISDELKIPSFTLSQLVTASLPVVYLSGMASTQEEGSGEPVFDDVIEDETAGDDFQAIIDDEDGVRSLLLSTIEQTLSPDDAYIICARFGLGRPFETLRSIAANLGISFQRIREREKRALAKLGKELRRGGWSMDNFF